MVESVTLYACKMRQGTQTGYWLTVLPPTANGIDLGPREWRDALFLCYGIEPLDLLTHCDGWNAKFSIYHSLDCIKGVLIKTVQNKICDGVTLLTDNDFTPLNVRKYYFINQCGAIWEGKAKPAWSPTKNPPETSENLDQKGELLIRDLW